MEEQESPIAKCTFDPEKEGPCKEKDCPHFPGIDWEKCRWGELPPEDRPIVERLFDVSCVDCGEGHLSWSAGSIRTWLELHNCGGDTE